MYDATFKVIVFGDESVDKYKTALIQRLLTNLFVSNQAMTIGADFEVKSLSVDGLKVKLQIWDFAGGERLRFLLSSYIKGALGGLFLFDITNYSSIAHIDDWLSVIRKGVGTEVKFPILVVGILLDEGNERQVSTEEGIKIAKSRKLKGYFECNLKTGENVKRVFDELTRLILANEEYQTPIKIKKNEEFIVNYLKNTGDPTKLFSIDQGDELQEILNGFRLESMEVTDPLPDMRYPRKIEREKEALKFLEEKLNNYIDSFERMMVVILRNTDLVDQSLSTVNQKLSTLESRIKDSRKKRDENDDDTPYPYIFKPPEPPDDFEPVPQSQIRASSKEKKIEDEYYCQYCGRSLTKDEQFTHSCNRFYLG